MNYFDFYKIPVSFTVDAARLKKQFYQYSKEYHPDFYTLESEEKQAEVLQLSTLNNEAYKTLSNFDLRMKYVLELKNVLAEEGKNNIPQDFLMEMMEINEVLMELEFDFDQKVFDQTFLTLKQLEDSLFEALQISLKEFDYQNTSAEEWAKIKDYYLKKRYLIRLRKGFDKYLK